MSTVEKFKSYVASVEAKDGYKKPIAFALGTKRSKNEKSRVMNPNLNLLYALCKGVLFFLSVIKNS